MSEYGAAPPAINTVAIYLSTYLGGGVDLPHMMLMAAQSTIVGLISQKGGVGKSTLARALAAVVAHSGFRVRIADLDPRQQTVVAWERIRAQEGLSAISVGGYDDAAAAIASARDDELLIIDTPSGATRATLEIAASATLIVQPTGAGIDDLRPAVLLFHELVEAGIPRERLTFALCRILTNAEETAARRYLTDAGYDVLPGCIPERSSFRDAHNRGHALTETSSLHARVDPLIEALLTRIAHARAARERKPRKRTVRKGTQP